MRYVPIISLILSSVLFLAIWRGPSQECERAVYASDDGSQSAQILNPDGITLPKFPSFPFWLDHQAYGAHCTIYFDGGFTPVNVDGQELSRYTQSPSELATSLYECATGTLINMNAVFVEHMRERLLTTMATCTLLRKEAQGATP